MSDAGSGANRVDAQHRSRENAPSASDYPPVDVASLGESEANAVRNSAPPAELRVATVGKRARAAAHDEGLLRGLVDTTTRVVRAAVDAIRRPLDAGLRVAGLNR